MDYTSGFVRNKPWFSKNCPRSYFVFLVDIVYSDSVFEYQVTSQDSSSSLPVS